MTTTTYTVNGLGRPVFQEWPKIPRLFRDMTITEKIDGTNAAVCIWPVVELEALALNDHDDIIVESDVPLLVFAQSRTRIITPSQDNHGFAKWVQDNTATLVNDLGTGRHYGEWWGNGIQRGYGLANGDKRFSLFNTSRHGATEFTTPGVATVPVLYEGLFDSTAVTTWLHELSIGGSEAAPGFDKPEGVCVYHHAANKVFKATIENDEAPKGKQP